MGWFSRLSDVHRLKKRVSELEEDVESIKRALRKGDLEISEWYEKVRHALSRLAKRRDMIEATREPEEEATAPLTVDSSDGLSHQQRQWNEKILAARGMRVQS